MIDMEIGFRGSKWWYKDGILHRANGPAIKYPDGYQEWHENGLRHRTDGPARILENGQVEYWINDKHVTEYEVMFMTG